MRSLLNSVLKLITGRWLLWLLSIPWALGEFYQFPTGGISSDDDPLLHDIEAKLTPQEKALWAANRERVRRLVIKQSIECGLGMIGVKVLIHRWTSLSVEEVTKRLKSYPPAVGAYIFQKLLMKQFQRAINGGFKDLKAGEHFMATFLRTKDPIIVPILAHNLCFPPTATHAADTLVHFDSRTTIDLVEQAMTSIDPAIGELIHRLVEEMIPLLSGDTFYSWGNSYFDEGKYPEAIEAYTEALKRGITGFPIYWLYVLRGRCRLLLEGVNDAEMDDGDVKKAIELGMNPGEAYLVVGDGFLSHGISRNDEQALEMALCYYEKAEMQGNNSRKLFYSKYQALAKLRRYIEADEVLIKEARIRRGLNPDKEWWGDVEIPWVMEQS